MTGRPFGRLTLLAAMCLAGGCSALLPRSQEITASPWESYRDAQLTFDQIVPNETTEEELYSLGVDPDTMPNIAILNYSDVLRRFMLNQSVALTDLDLGVQECVAAKTECRGYEINQRLVKKHRNGSFWLDFLGFKRETHLEGWRFSALLLLKDGIVVYKLTGGQPVIQESEHSQNPLGPVQSIGSKLFGGWI